MRVLLAKEYGFCGGVKRALARMDKALADNPDKAIFSIGPIIHNNSVIEKYIAKGVTIVDSIEEAAKGVGVVRAHGLPHSVIAAARKRGQIIIDATCPFVRDISSLIRKALESGNQVFIVGEPEHPEMVASTADFGARVTIINHASFFANSFVYPTGPVVLLCQTTIAQERYNEIAAAFAAHVPELIVKNTICQSTRERQNAALETAKQCDAMVVLGGKNSSNSRRLAELCSSVVYTQFIESIAHLDLNALRIAIKRALKNGSAVFPGEPSALNEALIGVSAGASTPDELVSEAVAFLERLDLTNDDPRS